MNSTSIAKLRKELEDAKKDLLAKEQKLKRSEAKQLLSLPSRAGLGSVDELIKALVPHASPAMKARFARQASGRAEEGHDPVSKTKSPTKRLRTRKRGRITPEMKQKVKEAVLAGKTGEVIAKEVGISLPSVGNIKREFGLTKKRR